jgi:hypothetical protein
MATTTNYSFEKPTVGGNEDTWGTLLNGNWDALDTLLGGVSATEFAILDGATVTTAELNILDGVTATTAEINYVDGVTSAIQTQLDAKYEAVTQDTATWEVGTGTTDSLVSPAKIAAAIASLVTSSDVLSFVAGSSAGGVGSYVFARKSGTALFGETYAGDSLIAAGGVAAELSDANTAFNSNTEVLSGTWRCMGDQTSNNPGGDHPYSWTIFLRIA